MRATSATNFSQHSRFYPYRWDELEKLPSSKPLIKGLLDLGAMSLIYGESNCGKTFITLDIALHLALNLEWSGHKVRQGAVVYIAAEGGLGIRERLEAFRSYHKITGYGEFYVIPTGLDLCHDESDAQEIIKEINAIPNVALIVIDTLSRAMSGGNENNPDDMGRFICHCDKIREETKSHLMIIHHSGKDTTKGARGHSALRAAVDTEIEVTKDNSSNTVTAEIKKQRDKPIGRMYSFEMVIVPLGKDEDDEVLSSCILKPAQYIVKNKRNKPLKGQKKRALDILTNCLIEKGQIRQIQKDMKQVNSITIEDFRNALQISNIATSDKPDNVRRSISRIIDDLNNNGLSVTYGDYIWLPQ